MRRIQILVTLPHPEDLTIEDAETYVKAAVEGWIGGGDPDHPLYGITHGHVTAHVHRKSRAKEKD